MAEIELFNDNPLVDVSEKIRVQANVCQAETADNHVKVIIDKLEMQGIIKSATGVANFLNIPFARIPGRFRQANIIDPRCETGVIDCTEFGPLCPQDVDIPHQATKHLYPNILSRTDNSGEFSCLNLNVYAPPNAVSSRMKLPVLVWIHGGAFHYGANTDEYDGNYIVQHSIQIGRPVIVVTLNYRLGYYGFLTSRELKDEALRLGGSGYANLALHDQRLGLQWVQKNIHFFGGDGFEVTCAGESAGACSILFHLRSDFPAFQRAFILSPAAVSLADDRSAQACFDQLVDRCGVPASAPSRQKLDALRNLTPTEFNRITPPGVVTPIWDKEWFVDQSPESLPQDCRPFPSWARRIVVGAAKEEMALFGQHWAEWTGSQTISALKASIGDNEFAKQLLDTYDFKDDDIPGSSLDGLTQLASDLFFRKVAYDVAVLHPELPVSLYSFEQRDNLPQSPFRGRSYHSLGNSMFFRLPTVAGVDCVDPSTRATSNRMCEAAIQLAYGEQPWEPYLPAHKVMAFDGSQTVVRAAADKPLWLSMSLTAENQALLNNAIRDLMRF